MNDCPTCKAERDPKVLRARIAELQAEVERLKSASREVADHSLAMSSQNETLREQLDQLKSCQEVIRKQFMAAIDFALDDEDGCLEFLRDWRDGDYWPRFQRLHLAIGAVPAQPTVDKQPCPCTNGLCLNESGLGLNTDLYFCRSAKTEGGK